jgi:hypothetical protein
MLACAAALPVLAIALGARGQARSVWEGVYTEAQAKRGEALYFERCVRCHGATYMGGTDGAGALLTPRSMATGTACRSIRCSIACCDVPLDSRCRSAASRRPMLAFVFSINNSGQEGRTPRQAEMLGLIQFKASK